MGHHTSTHTWTWVEFADPFIICDKCGASVKGYIVSPGHDENWHNYPCRHFGMLNTCPSWSPVDGCRCREHLGYVPHSAAELIKEEPHEV